MTTEKKNNALPPWERSEAAKHPAATFVRMDKIILWKEAEGIALQDYALVGLSESMMAEGQRVPVEGVRRADGMVTIDRGAHRTATGRLLGWPGIWVVVHDSGDPAVRSRDAMARKLSRYELAQEGRRRAMAGESINRMRSTMAPELDNVWPPSDEWRAEFSAAGADEKKKMLTSRRMSQGQTLQGIMYGPGFRQVETLHKGQVPDTMYTDAELRKLGSAAAADMDAGQGGDRTDGPRTLKVVEEIMETRDEKRKKKEEKEVEDKRRDGKVIRMAADACMDGSREREMALWTLGVIDPPRWLADLMTQPDAPAAPAPKAAPAKKGGKV